MLPTRDGAVEYVWRVSYDAGREKRLKLTFVAEGGLVRIDFPPSAAVSSHILIEGAAKRMRDVFDQQRMTWDWPFDPARVSVVPLATGAQRYVRGGAETVAGLPCIDWTLQNKASDGAACITEDGVVLRASGLTTSRTGQTGTWTIEAITVRFGPQDPTLFKVPDDFKVTMSVKSK